ncbi:efflux transporter outer membrane subunit [Pseudodesulfovibrio cashew]|uniref:Efflux transporter outer membrane subunit n=1 Tax=Pseudodesulfovibrio cashew TaxID=2678688 RepID=A0A6I6JPK7_9BACT|nr:efflux transporter outer membrane subunit [Pseudodesulfovibrio cashew]QGY39564.1 efflux transporter outer membrane subunit [Pseudodesulfovibrio cashew]
MKFNITHSHFKAASPLLCLLLLVSACSPFKPSPRQEPVAPLPQAFSLYSEQEPDTGRWWEAFGNEELNGLVEEALAANTDILVAWARLRQAGATATQSAADKYPTLDATGDYSHTSTHDNGGPKRNTTAEEHAVGLSAGYEVDLWGRIRAASASDDYEFMATREDVRTTAMTVASEVVSRWLEIQAERRKKRILAEQIKANQTYLELIELRFRNSISTALDVYQQRQNLAGVQAKLPPVESNEQTLLHELALLMGKPAGSVTVSDADLPELSSLPGLGLPADLLAHRPDVRAAGLRLSSADWSVAAARADRLPSLNLAGTAEYSGTQLATLFNNWALGLAASIVGPIFDGGYRKAEVEKARGVVDERIADYRNTVYTAFKEVEDALVQEKWQKKYITALGTQHDAARTSLSEAVSRYTQGLDDYLPVLSALLSVQDLELTMADEQTNLLLYRVALHRALGGDWTDGLQPPAIETKPRETSTGNQG